MAFMNNKEDEEPSKTRWTPVGQATQTQEQQAMMIAALRPQPQGWVPPTVSEAAQPSPQQEVQSQQPPTSAPAAAVQSPHHSLENMPLFVKIDEYDTLVEEVAKIKSNIGRLGKMVSFLRDLSDVCEEASETVHDIEESLEDSQSALEGIFVKLEDVESVLSENKNVPGQAESVKKEVELQLDKKEEDIELKIAKLREQLKE